jgi:YbgC/YbaW family acyl-CoA thioester hydrolase
MPHRFTYARRATFAETDVAGIVHFANFFRYMEEAEHAFLRSLGISVHPGAASPGAVGWPRVSVSCEFRQPLRFEDEFVVEVLVEEVRPRAVVYQHRVWLGDALCAVGRVTAVCVSLETMRAVALPEEVAAALQPAPPQALEVPSRG